MGVTTGVTLCKWGNSQGLRIPKEMCDLLGVKVGASASIEADQVNSQLVITFERPAHTYRRSRKVSMEELCTNWSGGKVGKEWGGPDIGAEVVG